MLVMPLLYKGKIYNMEVRLKNVYEVEEKSIFEYPYESDVIVNGRSYNHSEYYVSNASHDSIVRFIRNHFVPSSSSFLLTSRKNNEGHMKTFQIQAPLSHVTDGLDMLYGSVLLDMKKQIPDRYKDRNISLKRLGVASHITEEKLKVLRKVVSSNSSFSTNKEKDEILHNFLDTFHFLNQFECRIIGNATILEKMIQGVMEPLSSIYTSSANEIRDYYQMAQENANEYAKLDYMTRIMTGDGLSWLSYEQDIRKVKSRDGKYGK